MYRLSRKILERVLIFPVLVLLVLCSVDPSSSGLPLTDADMATRGASPAEPQGLYLTPWWPLFFGEGEDVEVDCGAYTGGNPSSVVTRWVDSSGQTLGGGQDTRVVVSTTTTKPPDFKDLSAFSVTTLKINKLNLADAGDYTCVADRTLKGNQSEEIKSSISISVSKKGVVCGFESDDLCGWSVDNTSPIAWHRHSAGDADVINKARGARHDHTYGSSKHIGHFMDVDLDHHTPNTAVQTNLTALMVSPQYPAHQETRCMAFAFYMVAFKEQVVHLSIKLRPAIADTNHTDNTDTIFEITENDTEKWKSGFAEIAPQTEAYQILIESRMCSDKCRNQVTSIDDIRFLSGQCDKTPTRPDNRMKVRLVNGSRHDGLEGRLEVLHDGQWGSVCSNQFGDAEAKVVCRMLGASDPETAVARRKSELFGPAPENYVIWLDLLQCQGGEADLGDCLKTGITWAMAGNCTHEKDAAVICDWTEPNTQLTIIPTSPTTTTTTKPSTTTNTTTSKSTIPPTNSSKTTLSPPPSNSTPSTPTPSTPSPNPPSENETVPIVTPEPSDKTSIAQPTTSSNGTSSTTLSTSTPKAPTKKPSPKETTTTSVVKTTPPVVSTTTTNNTATPSKMQLEGGTNHAGVVIGIIVVVMAIGGVVVYALYRRKRKGKKSTYITFGNPSYSREHLPANDYSLESPLTLSSNGYTVLA